MTRWLFATTNVCDCCGCDGDFCLGQAGLLGRDIAPLLDNGLLNLPGIGAGT